MSYVKEFLPYMFRLFNSKIFSLFDAEDSLMDQEISSQLNSKSSRDSYVTAINRLREQQSKSAKIKLDNGKEVELSAS